MTATATQRQELREGDAHAARSSRHGWARHRHLDVLLVHRPHAARDLADAVHLLCYLYGRHPSLVDLTLAGCIAGPARAWLVEAANQFENERLYLVRLASAVGPWPSTPGAGQTEAALQSQRHAIETLARSERRGCALGATTALLADWPAIRPVLDHAAIRAGIDTPRSSLPSSESIVRVIKDAIDTASSERALGFGTEQLLLQHLALFDLLEARALARED